MENKGKRPIMVLPAWKADLRLIQDLGFTEAQRILRMREGNRQMADNKWANLEAARACSR